MNVPVSPSYQIPLVVLSYVIAVIGSLIALTAARRIVRPDGSFNRYNAITGGLALGGIGVWSMHFVGMLALKLDMGVSYSNRRDSHFARRGRARERIRARLCRASA